MADRIIRWTEAPSCCGAYCELPGAAAFAGGVMRGGAVTIGSGVLSLLPVRGAGVRVAAGVGRGVGVGVAAGVRGVAGARVATGAGVATGMTVRAAAAGAAGALALPPAAAAAAAAASGSAGAGAVPGKKRLFCWAPPGWVASESSICRGARVSVA